MRMRHLVMGLVPILLAGFATVPAASAATAPIKATARAEAAAATVIPSTAVLVPASTVVTGTDGTTFTTTFPSAFGAIAGAADLQGVPLTFSVSTMGVFVNAVAGLGGPPSWISYWLYAVNGWGPDVGAGDLHLLRGDKVVFYEVTTGAAATEQLVVRPSTIGPTPGQNVTFTVLGDDFTKPDSLADATRFQLDPATVQTPAQFPAVDGAVLHVGTRVYDLAAAPYAGGDSVTVSDLPKGTYAAWAEKAADASTTFVRSTKVLINVDVKPVLSRVSARPNPFVRGAQRVHVAFALSKTAHVRMVVRNRAGLVVTTLTRTFAAGSRELVWNGRTAVGHVVRRGVYTLKLTPTDPWGRIGKTATSWVTAR